MALGLQPPSSTPAPIPVGAVAPAAVQPSVNIGGVLTLQSAEAVLRAEEKARDETVAAAQAQPHIVGLAAHIQKFWSVARDAKQIPEQEMLRAVRARRGEYDPEKLAKIREQGGSEIYMMLFSMKARQAGSLLRDIILGEGSDKPWTTRPTPKPELPPQMVAEIVQGLTEEVYQAQMMGLMVTMAEMRQRVRDMRDQVEAQVMEEARHRSELMETKMEDQLLEGGYLNALDEFIEDLTTFKTAFVKGPVVRKRKKLSWGETGELIVEDSLKLEWERVDPFMIYPAPWAKSTNDAPLIERHRLTRADLNALRGVEGYSDEAITKVIAEFGMSGFHDWLAIDSTKAEVEGRNVIDASTNNDLIDALQYWGSVSGQMLIDWGMDKAQIPDAAAEYEVEAWMIGGYVIKAVLNHDPLSRRPYYMHSYERVPGAFWGNSLFDLMSDCQDMCNAAARATANNMGIASGPLVWINVERLPQGEDVEAIFPWKIFQGTSDPMGSTARPIEFFQPQSNVAELMGVYEKFSILADEYTGIPRYMTGTEGTPGAGRTASGLSMMIGNASKVIKQVVAGIDINILTPMLERLYYYNMRYGDDEDLKGDVCLVARGALSLTQKEQAQVRRNEFLAATANPFDLQIIGMEGRAELLRSAAQTLDMNADRIVPPVSVIRQRAMMQQIAMAQAAAQQQNDPNGQGGEGGGQPNKGGGQRPPKGNGQQLMNGAPMTDNFQPAGA